MKYPGIIAILLALALPGCNGKTKKNGATNHKPPQGDLVTIAGKKLNAAIFFKGVNRSRMPDLIQPLSDDRCALMAYSRPRHIHVYGLDMFATFDVAFLDSGRVVVETARLYQTDPRVE